MKAQDRGCAVEPHRGKADRLEVGQPLQDLPARQCADHLLQRRRLGRRPAILLRIWPQRVGLQTVLAESAATDCTTTTTTTNNNNTNANTNNDLTAPASRSLKLPAEEKARRTISLPLPSPAPVSSTTSATAATCGWDIPRSSVASAAARPASAPSGWSLNVPAAAGRGVSTVSTWKRLKDAAVDACTPGEPDQSQ